MPAEEFDAYLRALSSLLRLEPAQRAELADEFRDHLESRLEELTAAGVPRARAVETALEEFGDAAGLASHFTSQHRFRVRRRRRKALGKFVMKTLPAAAALAVLGAVAWLAAPPNPVLAPPGPAVAQDEPSFDDPAAPDEPAAPADVPTEEVTPAETADPPAFAGVPVRPAGPDAERAARVEAALREPTSLAGVRPGDTLATALDALAEIHRIDILPDAPALELEGLALDDIVLETPPNIEGYSLATSLRVLLENQEVPLTTVPRDGILFVTTEAEAQNHLPTRIYNVRDLLAGGPAGGDQPPDRAAVELVGVIVSVTGGPDAGGSWEDDGGYGTVERFNGLLAIRQTDAVHRQIEDLLAALRTAGAQRGWGGKGVIGRGVIREDAAGNVDVELDFPAAPDRRKAPGDRDATSRFDAGASGDFGTPGGAYADPRPAAPPGFHDPLGPARPAFYRRPARSGPRLKFRLNDRGDLWLGPEKVPAGREAVALEGQAAKVRGPVTVWVYSADPPPAARSRLEAIKAVAATSRIPYRVTLFTPVKVAPR